MRQSYTAYDVTTLVKSNAENAVGLWLGTGWMSMRHDDVEPGAGLVPHHKPAARLLLSIVTSDGKTHAITTDLSWKGSWDGPVRQNDIYGGEVYDARMELAGWSNASYDDTKWVAVHNVDEFKDKPYQLSWQPMEPIRALELNAPLSITAIAIGPVAPLCWLTSMRDVQTEPGANCIAAVGSAGDTNVVNGVPNCSGAVSEIVPGSTPSFLPGDPSWMFGFPLIFSYQHRYYGDVRMATMLYPGLKEFASYLKRTADAGKIGLVTWKKYGDWLEPGRVPSLDIIGQMSSSFNHVQTLRITRDTAMALGQTQDAAMFAAAYTEGQRAFHAAYWNASTATYGNGQQSALVYALYLGAVPTATVPTVFAKLLALIDMSIPTPQQKCSKPPRIGKTDLGFYQRCAFCSQRAFRSCALLTWM
jgi:hypothetical protein